MSRSSRFWERLFGQAGHKSKKGRTGRHDGHRQRSLSVEPLEERALLSVCTWDGGGADNNWYTPANWVGDARPSAGDSLIFAGTTRTATDNNYAANTQFASITFNNDDFTLSGNSVQLTGGTGISVASGVTDVTIGLNLTFPNNTVITVGSGAELAISGSVSFSGKQLLVQGAGETSFSGALSGRDFRANEGGTATFTDTSSLYTNAYVIAGSGSSGTINWKSTGTLITDAIYVGFGGLGYINQNMGTVTATNTTYGLNLCYSGSTYHIEHFEGTPGVLLIGSVFTTAPGTIEFAGGRLRAARSFTADANLSYHIADNWAYFDTMGYNVTVEGDFSGSGSLLKTYTGSLTLNGSDSHTGATRIGNGTLVLGDPLALQYSTLNLYSGDTGTFSFGSLTSATLGGLEGERNLSLQNASSAAVALTVGDNNDTTYSGILSGSGSLTKIGTGSLTLSGTNTFTGTTTISEGTVSASNIVVSGGGSNLGNAASAVVLGDATHQGVLSYTGNTATYTRGFTVNAGGGEIDVTTAGQTLTVGTNGISDGGALTIDGAGNTSISSVISGTGSLTKTGSGTLTLSGANTYSSTTTISAGTLAYGASNAIYTGAVTVNGGTLSLALTATRWAR